MYWAPLDKTAIHARPERSIAAANWAFVAAFAAFVLATGRVTAGGCQAYRVSVLAALRFGTW